MKMKKKNFKLKNTYHFNSQKMKSLIKKFQRSNFELKENELQNVQNTAIEEYSEDKVLLLLQEVFKPYEALVKFDTKHQFSKKLIDVEFLLFNRKQKILFYLTKGKLPFKIQYGNAYKVAVKVGNLHKVSQRNEFEKELLHYLKNLTKGIQQEQRVESICQEVIDERKLPLNIIRNADLDALNIDLFLQYFEHIGICLQIKNSRLNLSEKFGNFLIKRHNPFFKAYISNSTSYVISYRKKKRKLLKKEITTIVNNFLKKEINYKET